MKTVDCKNEAPTRPAMHAILLENLLHIFSFKWSQDRLDCQLLGLIRDDELQSNYKILRVRFYVKINLEFQRST